jgi:putative FmdB family regulatory protein
VPLYEYQCAKCGRFELIKKFSDPAVTTCPTCGRDITKLPSAPAFHLKGTGWYVTDYAKKSGGSDGSASSSSESSSKDSSSKDSSSKDSSSKDSSSSSKESSSKDSASKDSSSSTSGKDSATSGSSPSK